jgi:hypothetical protein
MNSRTFTNVSKHDIPLEFCFSKHMQTTQKVKTGSAVNCPKCGASIELTEALCHGLREEMTADLERQRREQNEALELREKKLELEKTRLLEAQTKIDEAVNARLTEERKALLEKARKEAGEANRVALESLQSDLTNQKDQLRLAQEKELQLLNEKAKLETDRNRMTLDMARKLDEERNKIADEARLHAIEAEKLKLADKDNKIVQLQKDIAALQQRAQQGSMQAQGETLELIIENELGSCFPFDEICEVKKGQRGADIVQRVKNAHGSLCGAILWESKRAKTFGGDWIAKLKEDRAKENADIAVLVTTQLPEGLEHMGERDGIWICLPRYACALAAALRQGLIQTNLCKVVQHGKSDKATMLYDYLCSSEFKQSLECITDAFKGLQDQLLAERIAFERQWKEREKHITRALKGAASFYGSIQGIAGRTALPEIQILQLPRQAPANAESMGK